MGYFDGAPQVQFNAGLDIAMTISEILKRCEFYARTGDFINWFNELQILERRLSSKIERSRNPDNIWKEIMESKEDKKHILLIYQKKNSRGKKVPYVIIHQMFSYLANYECILRKYADVFGYLGPELEDQSKAILQR